MAWIDKLVSRSPIKPMQQHMNVAVLCAREILPLLDAMAAGDLDAIRDRRAEIDRLEHEADEIKHEIRSHTPKRFMMALDRRTILEILDYQDSIADITQDIAELADQRNMHLPEVMKEPVMSLAKSVVTACEQGQRIIDELDELVETGFGDAEVRRVDEMILELGRLETETDRQLDMAARKLFEIEDDLGVATIFWHQVLRQIATLADLSERVGNRLRLLMAN
ncbi:MAG: TIGR00153 family protein [Proteobacteria bacterium]|nr:TIGR00153 family protein [Pseudomonadota bacterium]MDB4825325.1 TIGR00153 family protein [Gammaproteobacteria bacterium]MBT4356800.1 TIGR00153 family protein [Pseudomonadota bacterium]MBT4988269.1 TIGR00153 family protein [Pseudomonadota bacterium]MBT5190302.1 TIGR00153 family protein [Pseudomonadota bacterium]